MRDLFDIPPDIAYLNCAYLGPQAKAVTEAGLVALQRRRTPWAVDVSKVWFEEVEALRTLVAKLFGADSEGVALVSSASYGLAVAAANVRVKSGQHIVVLADQFPSNVYPWRALAVKTGATIRTVPRTGDWTTALLASIDERTAVVATPQVHWTDGTLVDLVAVGERVREVGAALVVDSSQSFGAMPLDLSAVRPDFLVSVGYKWQLGPLGLAYLYVDEKHRAGEPLEHNWLNRAKSHVFSRLVEYEDEFQPGARRFDMGQRNNLVSVPMALAALSLLDRWTIPFIARELGKKTARLAAKLEAKGIATVPADRRGPHFLAFSLPGTSPEALGERLKQEKIYVSVRATGVRVSPHLYNDDEEIDRLVAALPSR